MADEYRLRFKRAVHLAKNLPRQKAYSVKYSNGQLITFVNLLNHSRHIIQELYDSLEEEDLHCALWRLKECPSNHHYAISLMISIRGGKKRLVVPKQKRNIKKPKTAFFIAQIDKNPKIS